MKTISAKKTSTATAVVTTFALFILLTAAVTSCDKDDNDSNYDPPQPEAQKATVFSAAGDSSGIVGTINQFRSLLGDSLNFTPDKTTGRREINWDGVPSTFTNLDNFPPDFFNATNAADPAGRKRGLVYSNTGTGFRVDSTLYAEVDASYASQFQAFSKKRLFTAVGNNISETVFKVPGTDIPAFIRGFGLIFSDVDIANATTVEFFSGATSLGVFKAPVRTAQGGFSFVGVYFEKEKITRIKITSGNGVLAAGNKDISDGGADDLVVMDDFFYNEPIVNN